MFYFLSHHGLGQEEGLLVDFVSCLHTQYVLSNNKIIMEILLAGALYFYKRARKKKVHNAERTST